jgi:hypothetical protein
VGAPGEMLGGRGASGWRVVVDAGLTDTLVGDGAVDVPNCLNICSQRVAPVGIWFALAISCRKSSADWNCGVGLGTVPDGILPEKLNPRPWDGIDCPLEMRLCKLADMSLELPGGLGIHSGVNPPSGL